MIIAKRGNFTLNTKSYLGEHEYTTHDIEICRLTDEEGHRYSIASFSSNDYDEEKNIYYGCDIISVDKRLFNEEFTDDDLINIRHLVNLGYEIITTTEAVPSGFKVKKEITTQEWDSVNECLKPKKVIGYTIDDDLEEVKSW